MHDKAQEGETVRKKIWYIIVAAILLLLLLGYCPREFAVMAPAKDNYIVCRIEKSTDVNAIIVDEISGAWEESIWVENMEMYYTHYPYEFAHTGNTFYFYGDFTQAVNAEGYRVFHLEDWDVKYPVQHSSNFLIPFKHFICNFDML